MKKVGAILIVLFVVVFYFLNRSNSRLEDNPNTNDLGLKSVQIESNKTSKKKDQKSSQSKLEMKSEVFETNELGSEKSKLEELVEKLDGEKKKFFIGIMPFKGNTPFEVKELHFYKDLKNYPHVLCIEEGAGRFVFVMDLRLEKTFFYDWKSKKILFFSDKVEKKLNQNLISFKSVAVREDINAKYSFKSEVSGSSHFGTGTFDYSLFDSDRKKSWKFECEYNE